MSATADAGPIRTEHRGAVAILRLDRPPLHVLDIPAIEALDRALAAAEDSPAAAVVISSTGERAFSAGVEVKDHVPGKIEPMLRAFHAVFRRMHASRLVTLAAVKGACLGGGAELALSCDLVYAEEGSKIGLPEIRLACFPPVGLAALADRYGPRLAEMCLTGETVDGAEAHRRGFLSRLVPAGQAEAAAVAAAEAMASGSRSVLGLTVRTLRRLALPHFEHALEKAERAYLEDLVREPDMHEGIAAFVGKRPPRWGAAAGGGVP
jgi:cyclohexa-1,5-dienecarbonyl-CoA hydratase